MSKILILLGAILTLLLSLYLSQKGFSTGQQNLQNPIDIIKRNQNIENELRKHKPLIGDDYPGYKNHIYRVLTYTKHFLIAEKDGEELYHQYLPIIELALVYHDIGLWTDNTLAYLEPSIERASKAAKGQLSKEDIQILFDVIYNHHKVTSYKGSHKAIINAFRKADWIDASYGIVSYGMPSKHIKEVMSTIPNSGFHYTLLTIAPRIHGYKFHHIIRDMSKIFKV